MYCETGEMGQCREKWAKTWGETKHRLVLGLKYYNNKRYKQTDISLVLTPRPSSFSGFFFSPVESHHFSIAYQPSFLRHP